MVYDDSDPTLSKLIYEELPGADHLIQIPIFKRPEVTKWLFAQHK